MAVYLGRYICNLFNYFSLKNSLQYLNTQKCSQERKQLWLFLHILGSRRFGGHKLCSLQHHVPFLLSGPEPRGKFYFKTYLFIFWPCWVLVAAHGLLSCRMGGSSSLTRVQFPDSGPNLGALHWATTGQPAKTQERYFK